MSPLFNGIQAILGLSSAFISENAGPPTLNLTLKPLFSSGNVSAVATTMAISTPKLEAGATLLQLASIIANVPIADFGEDGIQARDQAGPLDLEIVDVPAKEQRTWRVSRPTEGDITVRYRAFPRNVSYSTPPGPRVDLRTDQGGLHGSGQNFIPNIPESDTVYDIRLLWDLEDAPPETSVVWTFGEGQEVRRRGPASDVSNTYYMVGPIRNITSPEKDFGFYWFGDPLPLFNATTVAETIRETYPKLVTFFNDTSGDPYRIFVRRSTGRGYGGSALKQSFMLEYDDYVRNVTEWQLYDLLVHEMVHNYPLMDLEGLPDADSPDAIWYDEGIATYYQVVLPYAFGVYTSAQFLGVLNDIASQYYTSPAREMSDARAARLAWSNTHAQRLPYYRGATYFMYLRAQIAAASDGQHSLERPVLALLERMRTGQSWGIEAWQRLLHSEIGVLADTSREAMASGEWVIAPPGDTFGPCFSIRRQDQFKLDLGFAEDSLAERMIRDLKPGSRAEQAGLRNGDRVVRNSFLFQAMESYSATMKLVIVSDGESEERSVEFWPRSWDKVEAWEWIQNPDGPETCSVV